MIVQPIHCVRLCAALAILTATSLQAGEPAGNKTSTPSATTEAAKFLRIRRDSDKEPIALESAVTRYVGQGPHHTPISVDLIGAVHVGEKEYYDRLNKLFTSYDAVLYELVAPPGTRLGPGSKRKSGHPISMLQHLMKNVLKLEFQLDQIDYRKPNMVHADMSPQQFAQSMKDRGESFLQMFFRMLGQSMAVQSRQSNVPSDAQLIVALLAKDRAFRLKRIMAEQFEDLESQLSVLYGPDGSTIITERNKKALEVLSRQIKAGKPRLAIFYGAGHLPDMEKRLLKDFGLKRKSQQWLVAWSLTKKQQPAAAPPPGGGKATKSAPSN